MCTQGDAGAKRLQQCLDAIGKIGESGQTTSIHGIHIVKNDAKKNGENIKKR